MSEIALYKALVSAGAPEAEARAAVDNLPRIQDVATKTDLAELYARDVERKADLDDLRTRDFATKADIVELNAKMVDLNAKMVDLKAEMIKWMVGLWLGGVGLMAAVMVAILRLFVTDA